MKNPLKLLKIELWVCVVLLIVNVVMLVMGLMAGSLKAIIIPLVGVVFMAVLYIMLSQQIAQVKKLMRDNEERTKQEKQDN